MAVLVLLAGASPPDGKAGNAPSEDQLIKPQATPPPVQIKRPDPLETPCGKGELNRSSDLCAQWQAADAASVSATWTMWTGIFAGLGLIVGAVTMGAAIAAALFAKEAARHTETGAFEAKRTADVAVADQRPWVSVTIVPRSIRWTKLKKGISFRYDVVFENLGKTLAHNFTFRIGYAFEGDGVTDAIAEHRAGAEADRQSAKQSLLPGEKWMFPGFTGLPKEKVHWLDSQAEDTIRMMPVILVSTYYRDTTQTSWLHTERFFSLVLKDDETRHAGILQTQLSLEADELIAWPRGETSTS